MLGDARATDTLAERFAATPKAVSSPAVLLLGSSNYSARLAGLLGLPFAFAHHFGGPGVEEALELYREQFQPSSALERPYAIVTAGVLVAEDEEEARYYAGPGQMLRLALRNGRFDPLLTPEATAASRDRELAAKLSADQFIGGAESVAEELRMLASRTGANEIMVVTVTYGLGERLRCLELLSRVWSVTGE